MIEYIDRPSALRALDPRLKIAWSVVVSLLAVTLAQPVWLAALFAVTLAPWLLLRPSFSQLRFLLVLAGVTVVGTMLSQGIFYPYHPRTEIFTLFHGCSLCREGLSYGAVQSLRLLAIFAAGILVVFITHSAEMILAMGYLRVPYAFAFMLTLALRFLPEVVEQAQRILLAQQLRGVSGSGFFGALHRFKFLLAPLMIASLRRARQVAIAAEVRAYTSDRLPMKPLRFTRCDWAVACGLLVFTVAGLLAVLSGYRTIPGGMR